MALKVDKLALVIFVKVTLSEEDCHWIVPVFPLNVNVVLFVPLHTVPAPEIVPATEMAKVCKPLALAEPVVFPASVVMLAAVDANTEMVLPFVTDEATSMVIQKKVVPLISWENAGNVCVPAAVGVKLVANNVAPANELVVLLQILKLTISEAV